MGDMALYRRLRPCRQRRQPLLPSLAGQHQIGLGGPNRMARKRDKLRRAQAGTIEQLHEGREPVDRRAGRGRPLAFQRLEQRSEEHTSELQSLMRISYAVFCLKKKKKSKSTREPTQP